MTTRTFRVCGSSFLVKDPALQYPPLDLPWDFVAPHEEGAVKNHGQDLATLHRRGGVTPGEMLGILDRKTFRPGYERKIIHQEERQAHDELKRRLADWQKGSAP